MKFTTQVAYIDIDTGEVLNIRPTEFKEKYNFVKRKDKSIIKDDHCTIIYIFEGTRKNETQLKLEFEKTNNQSL